MLSALLAFSPALPVSLSKFQRIAAVVFTIMVVWVNYSGGLQRIY